MSSYLVLNVMKLTDTKSTTRRSLRTNLKISLASSGRATLHELEVIIYIGGALHWIYSIPGFFFQNLSIFLCPCISVAPEKCPVIQNIIFII